MRFGKKCTVLARTKTATEGSDLTSYMHAFWHLFIPSRFGLRKIFEHKIDGGYYKMSFMMCNHRLILSAINPKRNVFFLTDLNLDVAGKGVSGSRPTYNYTLAFALQVMKTMGSFLLQPRHKGSCCNRQTCLCLTSNIGPSRKVEGKQE